MILKKWKHKWWFPYVRTLYFPIFIVFIVWITFFDANSLLVHRKLQKEIKKLEKEKTYLQKEIQKDRVEIKRISKESELKKFARENYYFKKENEEIYLIEYQDSLKNKEDD